MDEKVWHWSHRKRQAWREDALVGRRCFFRPDQGQKTRGLLLHPRDLEGRARLPRRRRHARQREEDYHSKPATEGFPLDFWREADRIHKRQRRQAARRAPPARELSTG